MNKYINVSCGGAVGLVLLIGSQVSASAASLVELFTSQGCSSCPPADKVLGELAKDPDIVALSFAVDYWDYLGWRDSNARPEFTQRQKLYARARGDRAVYTPQAVVNGREDVVGNDRTAIKAAISREQAQGLAPAVGVTAHLGADKVVVTVPAAGDGLAHHAAIWIAGYKAPETVEIKRGENRGQSLTYYNVVERWQVLGIWEGEAMTVELPLADIAQDSTAGLAVILQTKQDGAPGPIIGVTKLSLGKVNLSN